MSEDFNFVVVGGGSAGAVVASRLSEDPACRVALIEAGEAAVSSAPRVSPVSLTSAARGPWSLFVRSTACARPGRTRRAKARNRAVGDHRRGVSQTGAAVRLRALGRRSAEELDLRLAKPEEVRRCGGNWSVDSEERDFELVARGNDPAEHQAMRHVEDLDRGGA